MSTPYEILVRIRDGQTFAQVRSIENGIEGQPVAIELSGPEFQQFKNDFSASVVAENNQLKQTIADKTSEIADLTDEIARLQSLIPQQNPRLLYPYEFLQRFTQQERVAISTKAQNDPLTLTFLFGLFTVQKISLDDPETVAGIQYLVQAEVITAERGVEVLS